MISFYPNCTLPLQAPAFVAVANVRSTLDIVFSCLSTLVLCSWSILHLNVPPQFDPKTKVQRWRRKVAFLRLKIKWMLITVIVPEGILAKAVTELWSAYCHSKLLQKSADLDGVPWSMAHTFFADMGGFAIRFPPETSTESGSSQHSRPQIHLPSALELQDRAAESHVPDESPQNDTQTTSSPYPAVLETTRSEATTSNSGGPPSEEISPASPIRVNSEQEIERPELAQRPRDVNTGKSNDKQPPAPVAKTKSWFRRRMWDNQNWGRHRLRFRSRMESDSSSYGDIAWRPHDTHKLRGEEILSGLRLNFSDPRPTTFDNVRTLLALERDVWVLTASQLYEVRIRNIITLPCITEDELSDRNKGDVLVKLLALVNVIWMIIQMVARAVSHKPSSPLEIMTLSFAACAFITYLLLLEHPQDVATPVYLPALRSGDAEDMMELAMLSPTRLWSFGQIIYCVPSNTYHHMWPMKPPVPSEAILVTSGTLGALAFGGLHLFAWDSPFPNDVERLLWRVCSLITMLSPAGTVAFAELYVWLSTHFRGRGLSLGKDYPYTAFVLIGVVALVLARLFLVVEAFRSLYYLPPDAYVATWAANIPHIT